MALKKSELNSTLWQSCDELGEGMDVVLTNMETTLSALELRRDNISALKWGMMQGVITERTRLA